MYHSTDAKQEVKPIEETGVQGHGSISVSNKLHMEEFKDSDEFTVESLSNIFLKITEVFLCFGDFIFDELLKLLVNLSF